MASAAPSAAASSPPSAGTSASAGGDGVKCPVHANSVAVSAGFDFASMKGTVAVDGASSRRLQVKAVPQGATYSLLFEGYAPGDHAPSGEKLSKGKSVVARLVSVGEDTRLYFDSDFHPAVSVPSTGYFACPR